MKREYWKVLSELLTEPAADSPSPFEHRMVAVPSETNAWAASL